MDRLLQTLPRVSGTSKGDNGRIGVVGGAIEYPGQPAITGTAALRAGSDVVELLVPEAIHRISASYSPNLLADRYDGERFDEGAVDRALELAEWSDALVVGPGLSDYEPEAVEELVSAADVPVVVDAIAIGPALDADLSDTVFSPTAPRRSGSRTSTARSSGSRRRPTRW